MFESDAPAPTRLDPRPRRAGLGDGGLDDGGSPIPKQRSASPIHYYIMISECIVQVKIWSPQDAVGIIGIGEICRAKLDGNDVDFHLEPMSPRGQNHTFDGGDVGVVSSPSDDNVVVLDRRCVGRIEVFPS